MASKLIEEYFPKVAEYINSDKITGNRVGHHNYVIEQKVLKLLTPLTSQSKNKIEKLDEEFLRYLKRLDAE